MKIKILAFISILTLILSFSFITPKTEASELYEDYNAMVVGWDDFDSFTLTLFDYEGTYNIFITVDDIKDIFGNNLLENRRFENGIKLNILQFLPNNKFIAEIVDEKVINYLTKDDLIDLAVYEYKGVIDNKHLFQRGLNFYKLDLETTNFNNTISGEVEFITSTKSGNFYTWYSDFDSFQFTNSLEYQYFLALQRTEQELAKAYKDGYESGLAVADGLIEEEYIRGYNNGYKTGDTDGYNKGYNEGYNKAYDEIDTSGEDYQLGYDNGYKAGFNDKKLDNTTTFYDNLKNWLVPTVITVIVLGGIFSIMAIKRREQ